MMAPPTGSQISSPVLVLLQLPLRSRGSNREGNSCARPPPTCLPETLSAMSARAVLDGRFRASWRGIRGGTAGRAQTAIATPAKKGRLHPGVRQLVPLGERLEADAMNQPLFVGVEAPGSLSCSNVGSHHKIARNPSKACSTFAWNRKATGSYDGVTSTLVYMAFA